MYTLNEHFQTHGMANRDIHEYVNTQILTYKRLTCTHLYTYACTRILQYDSFSPSLSWRIHITCLAKTASKKLGVLRRFHEYVSLYTITVDGRGSHPFPYGLCGSRVWGGSTFTSLLNREESNAFRFLLLVHFSLFLLGVKLHLSHLLFYSYYTGHCSSVLSTVCFLPSGGIVNVNSVCHVHNWSFVEHFIFIHLFPLLVSA